MKEKNAKAVCVPEDGLEEYNLFTVCIEDAKKYLYNLQEFALQEIQADAKCCAFKRDINPLLFEMTTLVKKLVERNLDTAYRIVKDRHDHVATYERSALPSIWKEKECKCKLSLEG